MGSQIFLDNKSIKVEEKDIQGDVLVGLQKQEQSFIFFTISKDKSSVLNFKSALKKLIPQIATTEKTRIYEQTHGPAELDVKVNIAFTAVGLAKLAVPPFVGFDPGARIIDLPDGGKGLPFPGTDPALKAVDPAFRQGMKAAATALGDDLANWLPAFKDGKLDGVVIVAGRDSLRSKTPGAVGRAADAIIAQFGGAIDPPHIEKGALNPKARGHEVFGFADGVSQPAVEGLHKPVAADDQSFPGQDIVKLGDFVLGKYDREKGGTSKPPVPWMNNGSYLVFRRLKQDVKAFNDYTQGNFQGLADSAEHFAAKLIGRWTDGSPLARDPVSKNAAHDESQPTENNDFEFGVVKVGQSRCPFNAHIRRVYPRSDIQGGDGNAETRRILRAGIAYDQTPAGGADDKGLLFVCYQSSIVDKFDFIQKSWCNQSAIPFDPPYPPAPGTDKNPLMPKQPGIDLIIGQGPQPRAADWTVEDGAGPALTLSKVPQFVTSTGGEYFFSPSISGLGTLAALPKI